MFRDFLSFFFFFPLFISSCRLFAPPPPPLSRILSHSRRDVEYLDRQFLHLSFFLPRIKNEKGSWGEDIRGCKGRKCAHVGDKRNDKTKKKQPAFHTGLESFEKFRNIASYGFYFTIRS